MHIPMQSSPSHASRQTRCKTYTIFFGEKGIDRRATDQCALLDRNRHAEVRHPNPLTLWLLAQIDEITKPPLFQLFFLPLPEIFRYIKDR